MSKHYYLNFAWNGISKNKKFYIPFLLACACMIMVFYIPFSLMEQYRGQTIGAMLEIGSFIVAFFSIIIIGYTNKFVFKTRTKELGLYNILGLNKKNIAMILLWETVICFLASYFSGMVFGMIFAKLGELIINYILNADVNYGFTLSFSPMFAAFKIYAIEFAILYVINLIRLGCTNPINLLHNESEGDRPPKTRWLMFVLGVLCLGFGYFLALWVEKPVSAIALFFIAVFFVIVGTYLLFICGSVALCRILQKNKAYYYKTQHFISLSSMIFRMKRNGAGLATICILSTMVLVSFSTTAELYYGSTDILDKQTPHSININAAYSYPEYIEDDFYSASRNAFENTLGEYKDDIKGYYFLNTVHFDARIEDGKMEIISNSTAMDSIYYRNEFDIEMMDLKSFNELKGTDYTLGQNELFCYGEINRLTDLNIVTSLGNGYVLKPVDASGLWTVSSENLIPEIYLVAENPLDFVKEAGADEAYINYSLSAGVDFIEEDQRCIDCFNELYNVLSPYYKEGIYKGFRVSCRPQEMDFIIKEYGSLFFIGILLSFVFLFAAVLIIYYKQISEGFEDQSRFEIMQKVGMTRKDIKKSINSQMLIVFFLPLLAAGMHLAFAFPMIQKMLVVFSLTNTALMAWVTFITLVIYAVFYVIVYKITTSAYYSISIMENKR